MEDVVNFHFIYEYLTNIIIILLLLYDIITANSDNIFLYLFKKLLLINICSKIIILIFNYKLYIF